MESQFDCNVKFKDKINEIPIEEMRFLPVGRDKNGMAYWFFLVGKNIFWIETVALCQVIEYNIF